MRITPAGAGKTSVFVMRLKCSQDHPRRCGENFLPLHRKSHNTGSPPQVRGKQEFSVARPRKERITPAGAGKTIFERCSVNEHQDHPRRCGENKSKARRLRELIGSPPQVRGKLCAVCVKLSLPGITPAGAGKTWTMEHLPAMDEDHPRRCGENLAVGDAAAVKEGSPPQVRGKRLRNHRGRAEPGITPAGAGKTHTLTV